MEENLNPHGYFVESPKSSNAERPCNDAECVDGDDQDSSDPWDSTSSAIFLLSSRPSSATFSSETSTSLWRNGSSRTAMPWPSPLCTTMMRNRGVETNLIKLDEESGEEEQGIPRLWVWSLLVMIICALALTFIVWLLLRSEPPELNVQDFRFNRVDVFPGSDRTGVPTYMISVNSMFNLTLKNRSQRYKLQLGNSMFTLNYNQIRIAQGQVSWGLKQESDSVIVASTSVSCLEAPLYGSGPLLQASLADKGLADFILSGTIGTELRIIRGIWNKHFIQNIRCAVMVHVSTLHVIHMDCKSTETR